MPRSSDPIPETKIMNATLQVLEKRIRNNLDRTQRETGMAPNADFNGKPRSLLQGLTQEVGTLIP